MTLPALVPSARLYTPGNLPQAVQQSLNGVVTGFRRGNRRVAQTLALSYGNLDETDLNLLKAHFIDRKGTYDLFYLSAEVWSGFTTPPVPLLSDFTWKYRAPLAISQASCGRYNVEVELETEPVDIGDLILDAGLASASPARDYTVNGGLAAAAPARDYVISPGGAA